MASGENPAVHVAGRKRKRIVNLRGFAIIKVWQHVKNDEEHTERICT